MNNADAEQSTQIEVADFGPIASAKIDLRPLTVFVGPNNTGKSYLATLIYALHRFFASGVEGAGQPGWRSSHDRSRRAGRALSDESVNCLLEAARAFADDRSPDDPSGIPLTPEIADTLRRRLEGRADGIAHEIGRCFGVDDSHALIRKGRTGAARVCVRRQTHDDAGLDQHVLTLGRKVTFRSVIPAGERVPVGPRMAARIKREIRSHLSFLGEGSGSATQRRFAAEGVLAAFEDLALPAALHALRTPAFLVPTSRTSLMHAHTLAGGTSPANASVAARRPATRMPGLSGVQADFLEQLIAIGFRSRARPTPTPDFGTGIEEEVLGGVVRVHRSSPTDYPEFSHRPKGWKKDLPPVNASSTFAELAPVILYLRYHVGPGNVLIVEEPEAHLHPELQVVVTEQLAALANAGIRVIVTTHSEWLLEALANIVLRSERSVHRRCRVVDSNVALRAEQVGVWLFEPKRRSRGTAVREIRIDDSGLFPTGYGDVAAALHNEWADLLSETGVAY